MAEQKKKKSKALLGVVINFVVCCLVGGCLGVLLAKEDVDFDPAKTLLIVMFFVIAFYLHLILHETGHMIAGLMTGYKFLSFRIGSFMWEKQNDGRIRFSRFSLAGTGGQCLMCPPAYNEGNYPFVLYNLGGVMMNFFLAALSAMIALFLPVGPWMKVFLWLMVFVGVLVSLMNGIPIKSNTVNNDGSNVITIGKSAQAKRAFWLQMRINEEGAYGVRLKDMPEEWFDTEKFTEDDNAMVASIRVFKCNRLMDMQKLDEAENEMKPLVDHSAVPGVYRSLMKYDLAYCELMLHEPGEAVKALESKEMQQFAKVMKNFLTIIRTRYAVALLKDRDKQAAEKNLVQFEKAIKAYPRSCEADGEKELMQLANEKSAADTENA